MTTVEQSTIRAAVRDGIARSVAAIGLAGVALIHLLDLPGQLTDTPYMFFLYLALMVSSVALAGALICASDARVWAAATVLPALVIVGYVLSRTTGLPQSSDDVGNWSEPLGMASLFVEGSLVTLGSAVLLARRVREGLNAFGGTWDALSPAGANVAKHAANSSGTGGY
jgi:hypothetical protein